MAMPTEVEVEHMRQDLDIVTQYWGILERLENTQPYEFHDDMPEHLCIPPPFYFTALINADEVFKVRHHKVSMTFADCFMFCILHFYRSVPTIPLPAKFMSFVLKMENVPSTLKPIPATISQQTQQLQQPDHPLDPYKPYYSRHNIMQLMHAFLFKYHKIAHKLHTLKNVDMNFPDTYYNNDGNLSEQLNEVDETDRRMFITEQRKQKFVIEDKVIQQFKITGGIKYLWLRNKELYQDLIAFVVCILTHAAHYAFYDDASASTVIANATTIGEAEFEFIHLCAMFYRFAVCHVLSMPGRWVFSSIKGLNIVSDEPGEQTALSILRNDIAESIAESLISAQTAANTTTNESNAHVFIEVVSEIRERVHKMVTLLCKQEYYLMESFENFYYLYEPWFYTDLHNYHHRTNRLLLKIKDASPKNSAIDVTMKLLLEFDKDFSTVINRQDSCADFQRKVSKEVVEKRGLPAESMKHTLYEIVCLIVTCRWFKTYGNYSAWERDYIYQLHEYTYETVKIMKIQETVPLIVQYAPYQWAVFYRYELYVGTFDMVLSKWVDIVLSEPFNGKLPIVSTGFTTHCFLSFDDFLTSGMGNGDDKINEQSNTDCDEQMDNEPAPDEIVDVETYMKQMREIIDIEFKEMNRKTKRKLHDLEYPNGDDNTYLEDGKNEKKEPVNKRKKTS